MFGFQKLEMTLDMACTCKGTGHIGIRNSITRPGMASART